MRRERGERGVKAGCRQVQARGGADHRDRRQPLPVGDQEGDGWEARLHRKYPGCLAEKQFVVHLWTLRQNVSRRVVVPTLGVNRSAP